jgi:hypothetical protein
LGEAVSSSLIVEGHNLIVTEVVERAVAERPGHDTIESIIEWLGLHQLRGLDLPHELFTPLVV